ncbi:hypothetical protein DXG03_002248, partial [Asterophora parasitica]
GVSGTGKSTLGNALADALGFPYVEGDDLHPATNVAKMASGTPLTDADREPWLALIRTTAERIALDGDSSSPSNDTTSRTAATGNGADEQKEKKRPGVVISSSALKRYYREILRGQKAVEGSSSTPRELPTYFLFIEGPRQVLLERMEKRAGHFMKASMLDSQLNTLESPVGEEGVVVVAVEDSTEEQLRKAVEGLSRILGYKVGLRTVVNSKI